MSCIVFGGWARLERETNCAFFNSFPACRFLNAVKKWDRFLKPIGR